MTRACHVRKRSCAPFAISPCWSSAMKISFRPLRLTQVLTPVALGALLMLGGCFGSDDNGAPVDTTTALQNKVQNIVVIYAKTAPSTNLYGNFPGANGLSTVVDSTGKVTAAYIAQKDRNGTVLATLPPVWGGVTAPGSTVTVTQAQSAGLANAPFNIGTAFKASANAPSTAASSPATCITVSSRTRCSQRRQERHVRRLRRLGRSGAFGGSFLNHQYLICACAPEYPNADTAAAKPTIQVLDKNADGSYTSNLTLAGTSKASALDGAPTFAGSGNITPANYFGDSKFYAVNTMQPAFQPSGNGPADLNGNNALYADTSKATTLPAQTQQNIGDLLTAKSVNWAWYGGSWSNASKDGQQVATAKRTVIYAGNANGVAATDAVDFQPHHQPFNYYANMDP
ncbi:phosphoesterase family domain-containing protein [Ditylenchus destructor]|nr:phosphoesterase family domain-containing protein [Ditylenchus destructor]